MQLSIPIQFIGQNLHFGVNLFAALACFAASWLYLDAWSGRKHIPGLAKGLGFLLLTAGFLAQGTTWGAASWLDLAAGFLKLGGYVAVAIGHLLDPVQARPKIDGYSQVPAVTLTLSAQTIAPVVTTALPLAALTVAALYWRMATTGLERHLKPLALAFLVMSASEGLAIAYSWQTSTSPLLQALGGPLGPFWIAQHIFLLMGAGILAWWVWRYLTKRLLSQLFLTITSLTFGIVLIAAVSLTALLLNNLQRDALRGLETTAKILDYAIDSKAADTRSAAQILAQNPVLAAETNEQHRTQLANLVGEMLIQKQLSEIIITSNAGVVLARASDPERTGDSLSNNTLVQQALTGSTVSSLTSHAGAITPTLVITTASPIRTSGRIIGTTLASLALDNAFVDHLKSTTGLDSAIYVGAVRTATTLTGTDGTTRALGVKETNTTILNTTLKQGQTWHGLTTVSNQPFLGIYLPLKASEQRIIGMLFVGQSQSVLLQSAEQAVRLTFLGAAVLLLLIMIPVYLIARKITVQLH